MRLRSSIVSVVSIFTIALALFVIASMTPIVPIACADGSGNEPQPKEPDTTHVDSTMLMPAAPGAEDPTVVEWMIDIVTSLF